MEKEKVRLSDMPLKRKIAQMVIVGAGYFDPRYAKMGLGGFYVPPYLSPVMSRKRYEGMVRAFQEGSEVKMLATLDMEGYWNPFKRFYKSRVLGDIKNEEEASALGREHGEIITDIGFNMNFSPVVEAKNIVWPGRSFNGNHDEIRRKSAAYIQGLQSTEVIATAKHFPGGSMVKNPHFVRSEAEISEQDLSLFENAKEAGVKAAMVGHPAVHGAVDSNKRPSTVSPAVISRLREGFDGLIITDSIGMAGLKTHYLFDNKGLYVDLVKAGNDIILDSVFGLPHQRGIKNGLEGIEKAVETGAIPESRIDESVRRILTAKGYEVAA